MLERITEYLTAHAARLLEIGKEEFLHRGRGALVMVHRFGDATTSVRYHTHETFAEDHDPLETTVETYEVETQVVVMVLTTFPPAIYSFLTDGVHVDLIETESVTLLSVTP